MSKNKVWPRALAGAVALMLFGAACNMGGADSTAAASGETTEDSTVDTAAEVQPTVDTPAATLQQGLTSLLSGHEYLAGIAVVMGVEHGPDSPQFKAAAGSLDANSRGLAAAIGSIYGKPAEKQFLKLWRAHIGFFVDYALAKAGGDDAGQKEALKNLDGYRADFGALIEGATEGELTQEQVAEALTPHVDMTVAAIDAVVAGDASAFDKLRKAANHLTHIATALSGAIVAQMPDKF